MLPIKRTAIRLKADPRKVIVKFLNFGDPARIEPVVKYLLELSEQAAQEQLANILEEFEHRHDDLQAVFLNNFKKLNEVTPDELPHSQKMLIGAFFTHEYSIEAAALFNPSIVPHPDQSNIAEDTLRFVLSLRATGEGHISSIAFQTGIITANGEITLEPRADKLSIGQLKEGFQLSKDYVLRHWREKDDFTELIHKSLPGQFSKSEAMANLTHLEQEHNFNSRPAREQLSRLFDENYDLHFPAHIPLTGRVLFPQSDVESNGMEDARFVYFNDAGNSCYYGTYTAYNGRAIQPHLIETKNFQDFKIRPFGGAAASNKGMALFPEKINGRFAMVGRQGGRDLSIMYSKDLLFWEEYELLQSPHREWEILQMGNCGSPVKTPKGWLLLTHAVGAMRKYVLSFTLLDLHRPERVLASLEEPLLSPNAEEREGYVPNVLYTCGLLQHQGNLVIPYAMSDSSISFAVVETESVLKVLTEG